MRDLVNEEGENRAVRTFLMLYGGSVSITVDQMINHMEISGWDSLYPSFMPPWAKKGDKSHLTKSGVQLWIRYLFELEKGFEPVTEDKGPWQVDLWQGCNEEQSRVVLQSHDFAHDVALIVNGDFANIDQRVDYANMLLRKLNND